LPPLPGALVVRPLRFLVMTSGLAAAILATVQNCLTSRCSTVESAASWTMGRGAAG
jgi:hypothetical protein